MDRHGKFSVLFCATLLIVNFAVCLFVPMESKSKDEVENVFRNKVETIQRMEYVGTRKDCGNFLDPCGNKNDPPCCAPDFCLQDYCQNNTMVNTFQKL